MDIADNTMNKEQLKAKLASLDPAQRQALLARLQQQQAPVTAVAAAQTGGSLPPAQGSLAVSHAQTRMWLFEKINGSGAAYTIVSALHLQSVTTAAIDVAGIEWAFNQVVRRHEILRSAFVEQHGVLKTLIQPELQLTLPPAVLTQWQLPADQAAVTAQILQWAAVPFELSQTPLLRLRTLSLTDDSIVLVLLMHHIVADGWSLRLLEQELSQYYQQWQLAQRQPAAALAVQYQHYVAWEQQWLQQAQASQQLDYWRQQLQHAPTSLRLPELLSPQQAPLDLRASSYLLALPAALCQQVEQVATERQLSSFMLYLAALKLVLSHYSGDEDLVIGTPVAARRHSWQQGLIGLMSNTVALRSTASSDWSLAQYLQHLRRQCLAAFEHQELPFEKVVDAVAPVRQQDLPPLFQVLFALQSSADSALDLAGLQIQPLALPRHAAEFPLVAELFLTSQQGVMNWTYQQTRFSPEQIEALAQHLVQMLQLLLTRPELTIAEAGQHLAGAAAAVPASPVLAGTDWFRQQCALPATGLVWLDDKLPVAAAHWLRQVFSDRLATTADAAGICCRFVPGIQPDYAAEQQILVNPAPQQDGAALWLPVAGAESGAAAVVLWRPQTAAPIRCAWPLRLVNARQQPLAAGLFGQLQVWLDGQWQMLGLQAVRQQADFWLRQLGQDHQLGWCCGQAVDVAAISLQLQQLEQVAEAVVLVRQDPHGQQSLLAYLVPARPLDPRQLQSLAQQQLATLGYAGLVLTVTVVSELPRDGRGQLLTAPLLALPVLDSSLTAILTAQAAGWQLEPVRTPLPQLTLQPPAVVATAAATSSPAAPAAAALLQSAELTYPEVWVADLLRQAAAQAEPAGITSLWSDSADGHSLISSASYLDYRTLYQQALHIAAGLQQLGVVAGDIVALQLVEVQDILLAFWGAVLAGAVVLDIEMPANYQDPTDKDVLRLQHALAALPVKLAILPATIPAGAAQLLGQQQALVVASLAPLLACQQPWQPVQRQRDDALLLMLTSGSTGTPKIVVQTHGAVCYHAHSFAAAAGLNQQTVCFNWMPLQHVGGIVMCHTVPMLLNAAQIHCPTATIVKRPLDLLACLSHYRASMCWCPNFAFTLLNEAIEGTDLRQQGWDLSAMQVLLNGGEAVVQKTVQQLVSALAAIGLPANAVHPTWGMSETCSATLLNRHYQPFAVAESNYVSVGTAIPGVQFRVVDAEERLLPEGRSGRLQVRGPTVTPGYYQNPAVNQTAFTAQGWFNTGDLAMITQGELAIVGREKDLIIINGVNYHGLDIELCVETLPDILKAHTAACAVRRPTDDTDRLCLFYTPQPEVADQHQRICQQIRQLTGKQLGVVPAYIVPLAAQDFPRTSIGKIQRSELAQAFMAGEFDAALPGQDGAATDQLPAFFYRPIWRPEQQLWQRSRPTQVVALLSAAQWPQRHLLSSDWLAVTASTLPEQLPQLQTRAGGAQLQILDCRFYQHQPLNPALLTAEQGLAALWQTATVLLQQLTEPFGYILLTGQRESGTATIAPVSAGLAAALQALQAEFSQLRARHICLVSAAAATAEGCGVVPEPAWQQRLRLELLQPAALTVLLSPTERFVQRLQPVFSRAQKLTMPAVLPALQVVIGGLGGIGSQLCQQLLAQGQRLVIIGRRHWQQLSQQPQLQQLLQGLENYPQQWCYLAADATDAEALQQALRQACQQMALPLGRVFYLAGEARPAALPQQQAADVAAVLAAKVDGLSALQQALQDWPAAEQVHFCSATALLGGQHYHAYSVANAYQWAFCQSLQQQGKPVRCLLWSMWQQLGMSAGAEDAAVAAAGYHLLSAEQGWLALQAALSLADRSALLIGLDQHAPAMQRLALRPCEALFRPRLPQDCAREVVPATDRYGTAIAYLLAAQSAPSAQALASDPRYLQLQAVWAEVLQQSDLTPDANFFALGGDSILAIQCSARAASHGLFFQPRALFEQQTLAGLLQVMTAQQVTGEQETIQGTVPLMPMQHWFFAQNFSHAAQMNQSVLLSAPSALTQPQLQQALQQLLQYHDGLRAEFSQQQDGQWQQSYAATAVLDLQWLTVPELAEAEFNQLLLQHCERLQASLQLSAAPLLKAFYLDAAHPAQRRLFLAVHHLVIDGVSWRILVEDLNRLLADQSGQPATTVLGPKSHSIRQWHSAVQHYLTGPRAAEQANYWQLATATPAGMPPADLAGSNLRRDETQLELEFDSALTDTLFRQLPVAHGISADDLLLTALAVAFERWSGERTFAVLMEGHGRELPAGMEALDLTRTLGWFTAMYPLYLTTPVHSTLAQRVLDTHRQRQLVPDGGVSYQWLRTLGTERQQQQLAAALPAISYNYLGRFEASAAQGFSFAAEATGRQIAAEQHRPNEIDIVGRILAGKAAFAFIYSSCRYSAAQMATFVGYVRQALTDIAGLSAMDWQLASSQPALICGDGVSASMLTELSQADPALSERVSHLLTVTPVQLGVIFETLLSEQGVYVSQLVNDLSGQLNPSALQAAWQDVVNVHSIYRTGFVVTAQGQYLQRVERTVRLPFQQDDWRHLSAAAQDQAFEQLLQADRAQGFTLSAPPLLRITLLRLADQRYRMLMTEHHTVSDGWSRGLVLSQVAARYRLHAGETAAATPLPVAAQYHDYVYWLNRVDRQAAARYWRQLPLQQQPVSLLAGQQPRPATGSSSAGYQYQLSPQLSAALQQAARSAQVTLNAVAQAGWALLLHCYTADSAVVYATTHSGRPATLAGVESIVGPLINTLPVLAELTPDQTVQDLLSNLQQQLLQLSEYGYVSMADIAEFQQRRDLSALLQTLFVFENFPLTAPLASHAADLHIDSVRSIDSTEYPLTMSMVPDQAIKLLVYYLTAQFSASQVAQLCADYAQVLQVLCQSLSEPLSQVHWLAAPRSRELAQLRAARQPSASNAGATAAASVADIEMFEF
jgi:non-ribosomal peptide synthase protein (TIGR01720 family)